MHLAKYTRSLLATYCVYLWQLIVQICGQSTKSGSGVTKRHCNNVATDKTTDHVHSELIEWQEDSIYNRDDSKLSQFPVTLKDEMTMATSCSSIIIHLMCN